MEGPVIGGNLDGQRLEGPAPRMHQAVIEQHEGTLYSRVELYVYDREAGVWRFHASKPAPMFPAA